MIIMYNNSNNNANNNSNNNDNINNKYIIYDNIKYYVIKTIVTRLRNARRKRKL